MNYFTKGTKGASIMIKEKEMNSMLQKGTFFSFLFCPWFFITNLKEDMACSADGLEVLC
jgi:hypothetical protein